MTKIFVWAIGAFALACLVATPVRAQEIILPTVAPAQVVVYRPIVPAPATTVLSPVVTEPVVTTYRPIVSVPAVVSAPTVVYRPYVTALPAEPVVTPVVAYSPVVTPVVTYSPVVTYAVPAVVRTKVYYPGEPVRNFFKAVTP